RTGFGLSSVLVSISAGPAATTDLDGAFTLTNVEPGPRQIEADRNGYLPLVRSVTVTAGLTSALGLVDVTPRTADLTIHVQNPSGLAVEGATVLEVNSGQSVVTNAQGDARFPALPAGAEIFVVRAAGFPRAALDELLIENGIVDWIPIELSDFSAGAGSGTVHGVVKSETGLPIPGATVSLAGVAGSEVTTGADGAYAIAAPAGEYGDYVVVARATGYGTMASNRFRVGGTAEPWHILSDFSLSPAGSTATVTVTTRDVSVGAAAAGSAFVWTTPGLIEIETPPSGLRNAQIPAGIFYRSPADVSTMRRNLVAGSTTPLVVAAEPSAAPPADGWTFLSRVNRMATGEPLAGATVELRPPAGASTFLTSDVDGFVYGSANTSGEHRVFGSGSGYVETESAPFTPSVGSRFVRPEVYLPGDLDSGTLAIVQPAEGAQVAATFTVGVEATLPRTDDQITGILVELSDGAVSSAVATYTNGGRTASIVVAATFGSASQVLTVRARTRYEAELVATRNINTAMLGSVKAVKIASVVLSLPAVTAGAEVKGLVTLTAPAPAGGVRVTLESSRPRVGAVDPLSVVVPAGSTDAGFIVRVPRTVSAPASVTITARANGSRVSQTLAVTPPTVSRPMEPR
ncbi:MAG: carboxypeptidase regulatory-like domain-containing protein, partial [Acidobacteria bacterium]|nr:carboxypeptidase regulatory-like domain-containing protein [Acidobacteriota bacterium]